MSTPTVEHHYASPGLIDRIENGLAKLGKSTTTLTIDDLAPVDEFHVRGAAATAELIQLLAPTPGMQVLDLGSGLGGPARRLARATGCAVTGVDLSADYCAAGTALTAWCGLSDLVHLQPGDVTDLAALADASFDAAWTIHVGMNIADKEAFYRAVQRVLKPGAAFLIYDVFSATDQAIHFPVPWAKTAESSFLATIDEALLYLTQAGFAQLTVHDKTDAGLAFLERSISQRAQPATQQVAPPPLGLHVVVGPIFRTMIQSLHRNFAEHRVQLAAIHALRAG